LEGGADCQVSEISKEEKGISAKMENLALNYFTNRPDPKEGWEFLYCTHEELQEVLKSLVALTNPMKPRKMTVWVASSVVECLY
jgi:hypothetical protein